MNLSIFIEECFRIGIALLNKKNLTKEEKRLLNLLDKLEEWVLLRLGNDFKRKEVLVYEKIRQRKMGAVR